ncbi:MAG: winged helix-turn-helix domain-containing protein [Proteobacteria bacterium]|nr:winged helix-turn-helix domain-containing protein [Pseudomonadota bacterium]
MQEIREIMNMELKELKLGKGLEKYEGGGVKEATQKTTQRILDLIRQNPHITRRELSTIVGISENGIKFHLNKLKQKGLLQRV